MRIGVGQFGRRMLTVALFVVGPPACQALAQDDPDPGMPYIYDTWETFTSRDGLPHESIRSVHIRQEQVWVGTEAGLALYEDGAWKSWQFADAKRQDPLGPISAIAADPRTGDLWLGAWGYGILRFSAGRFDRFNQFNSGLAGDLVFSLVIADGRVWTATNGGVSVFDPRGDSWELLWERRADPLGQAIIALAVGSAETGVYAATWCGNVYKIGTGRHSVTMVMGPRPDIYFRRPTDSLTMAVDRTGDTVWWASQDTISRSEDDRSWKTRAIPKTGPDRPYVQCMAAPDGAEAWLGTNDGLRVLADWPTQTWVTYRRCPQETQTRVEVVRDGKVVSARIVELGLPDDAVRCIAFQGDDVWVGTANGLARATGAGRWSGLRPDQGDRSTFETPPPCQALKARQLTGRAEESLPGPVGIGVLGPASKTMTLPGDDTGPRGRIDLPAVQLAVQQANARGGYRGKTPFEVAFDLYGYARYGWNMPEDDFISLAYKGNVRGIIGYIEPGDHYSKAAALRTEVPLVNVADAPLTVDGSVHPWIYRCPPGDQQQSCAILDHLFDELGRRRPAVIRTPSRDAEFRLNRWIDYVRKRGHPVVADVPFDPHAGETAPLLQAIARSKADVVLTWCDAQTAANVVRDMRAAGMHQMFVGGDQIVNDDFVRLAGANAEPVLAFWSCPASADDLAEERFVEDYKEMFGRQPQPDAFSSYEAANHLIKAIRWAGLDRTEIARSLRQMDGVLMARLANGRWELLKPSLP